MATHESGRQFQVDRFTGQTFYREPVDGVYSPWIPLHPSDYHLLRPEAHNVRNSVRLRSLAILIWSSCFRLRCHITQDRIRFTPLTLSPPTLRSLLPTLLLQPRGTLPLMLNISNPPLSLRPQFTVTPPPVATTPAPQNSTKAEPEPTQIERRPARNLRPTQRSTRAYDPVRGQRTARPREGGRGRTRGAPGYKPQEVRVLLDHVEEELPIAAKGWRVVGAQFRDWAVVTEYPARTDRSWS